MRNLFRLLFPAGIILFLAVDARASREIDTDNLRPEVIACEEAIGRLTRCCPGFDPKQLACNYYYEHTRTEGCSTSTDATDSKTPALNVDESRCILASSCETLVAAGICERSQGAVERWVTSRTETDGRSTKTSGSHQDHEAVCP